MGLYFKITAGLLLLVQAFHLASLQDSTDSPGRTIDKSWLRDLVKNTLLSSDASTMDSSNDISSGKASGFMATFNEEEESLAGFLDNEESETSDDETAVTTTTPTTSTTNVTTIQPELPDITVSPTPATTDPTDPTTPSQVNMTEAEEEFHNFTTTPTPPPTTPQPSTHNSTGVSDNSNHTNLQTTTLAPTSNTTQQSTTEPDEDTGITNATSTYTTTATTTTKQEINKTSTTSPSTTVFPSETTETSPETTTGAAPITPETFNKTDKSAASGNNSNRDLATSTQKSKRNQAWAAVLGTGVAVACVGLVAYIILKKKHQKGFSHRKLVEEYPSDPVLRLDHNEPLDLNFGLGRAAYHNRGLQGDNIQMSNFP